MKKQDAPIHLLEHVQNAKPKGQWMEKLARFVDGQIRVYGKPVYHAAHTAGIYPERNATYVENK